MSEVDWKEKCKRVAEWLDQIWMQVDGEDRQHPDWLMHEWRKSDYDYDGCWDLVWPDYTRDDAAAWRLSCALPLAVDGVDLFADGWYWVQSHGEWDVYGTEHYGHDGLLFDTGQSDRAKAQVMWACELIDMGLEPTGDDD